MDKSPSKGVFRVGTPEVPKKRVLDVVFIHGLGGDAFTTWQADNDPEKFWPAWLSEDIKNIGVWTVGYGASPTSWIEDEMPMQERAINLLSHFLVKKIGDNPFILITHSMGGLIAKYLLTSAEQENSSKYRKIADNCTDIVFLAVPHHGSEMANIFEYARLIVRRNEIVRQLQKDEAGLLQLSFAFKNYVQRKNIRCISYYETKQMRIQKQGFFGMGKFVPFGKMVVSKSSAIGDFPQERPTPLEADHVSICKTNTRDDLLYAGMREIIERRIIDNKLDNTIIDDFDEIINQRISFLEEEHERIANKIQGISQEREQLKSEHISDFRDMADWLGANRKKLSERISTKAIVHYEKQINAHKFPKNEEDIGDFQLDISQFIAQLEVCLLEDSKKFLDEPLFTIEFDVELYEAALSCLLERVPDEVSSSSKERLKYFIHYLITRI